LVYSNEEKDVFWVKNAFKKNEHVIKLDKNYKTTSKLIVDIQQHFELDRSKNSKNYLFVDYLASVFSYVLIASGRIRAGMFKDWLWDVGGAWPIFDALCYKIYDFKENRYIKSLDKKDFTSDLKFKNAHIIGVNAEISYLKKMIIRDLEK
jgi:fructose-1,6-bisphosphatase/inositol monophosphatase family enzyme